MNNKKAKQLRAQARGICNPRETKIDAHRWQTWTWPAKSFRAIYKSLKRDYRANTITVLA
jgi:hypothetical protein